MDSQSRALAKAIARSRQLRARLRALSAEEDGLAWCPHAPHPKQQAFLDCRAFEAFYGGAAGGGKSDAILMDFLQDAHQPHWAGLIIRRTFADLAKPGAIMDRAKEWLIPQGVQWRDIDKRFVFPSGASLSFGYLDSDADRYRWQGAELQFLGIDEATQIPEPWYLYLLSRLRRREGSPARIRARLAGNPGGIGHAWVKRRFVDAADDARAFVPARLEDNPSLNREEYAATLSLLDPVTRRQLLEGIWVQDGSGLVYRQFDEARNGIETAPPGITRRVLGIDFGFVDATAWTLLGWRAHDPVTYILQSFGESGLTVADVADRTREILDRYPCDRVVGDIGGLGKPYVEEMRRRPPYIPVEAADKLNKFGYIGLMNGALARGSIKAVRGECAQLLQEWRELPWAESRQKEADGADNHCADSALYAWRASQSYTATDAPDLPTIGDRFQKREAAYLKEKEQQARAKKRWLTR